MSRLTEARLHRKSDFEKARTATQDIFSDVENIRIATQSVKKKNQIIIKTDDSRSGKRQIEEMAVKKEVLVSDDTVVFDNTLNNARHYQVMIIDLGIQIPQLTSGDILLALPEKTGGNLVKKDKLESRTIKTFARDPEADWQYNYNRDVSQVGDPAAWAGREDLMEIYRKYRDPIAERGDHLRGAYKHP